MLNEKLISNNKVIAVALSGGKDSMCLLNLLISKSKKLNITVKAVNVEHGIRGESSVSDSNFVKQYCDNQRIDLLTFKVDALTYSKNKGLSIEQSARILRYECFYKAINQGFCDCVATAHHQNDNIETILLNLFRGSSPSGLVGIKKISEDGAIIRPLLNSTRQQIDDYVKANEIPFVTDDTNFDSVYTRNFIRNELIPLIKTRFNNFENSVTRLSNIVENENEYLDNRSIALLIENGVKCNTQESDCIFTRACLIKLKQMGFTVDYTKAHLDLLLNLKNLNTGAKIILPNNLIAYKSYDNIIFEKANDFNKEQIDFTLNDVIYNGYKLSFKKAQLSEVDLKDKKYLYFDLDKLPKNCVIRTRQTGDLIHKFNGNVITLKKFFTDSKIDSRSSNEIPIIANEKNVFLVGKFAISDTIKVDKNSINVVQLYCYKL